MDNQMTDIIELAKQAGFLMVEDIDDKEIIISDGFTKMRITDQLTKFAQLLQQGEAVAAESRFTVGGDTTWKKSTIEHHYMVQENKDEWPNYETRLLYTTPPDTQAKLDKYREALQLGIEALEGEGIYPKTVAKLQQALKDIE